MTIGCIDTRLGQIKTCHRISIAGFSRLPDNGAQATFRRLLVTQSEMLHEALRTEWTRRHGKMIDVSKARRGDRIASQARTSPRDLDPWLEAGAIFSWHANIFTHWRRR